MKPHFLMSEVRCRRHTGCDDPACSFRVAWTINPHMQPGNDDVDIDIAEGQHSMLMDALITHGADVTKLPFVHGAYDSVFIKDSALLVEDEGIVRALLARPRFAQRQQEQRNREHALAAVGVDSIDNVDAPLECGDVAVLPGGRGALLGHGFRSSLRSVDALERFLQTQVTPLQLVDERLYHLDMALSVLRDGTVLACRAAFTANSWRALGRVHGVDKVVPVLHAAAMAFGLNLVELEDVVLVPSGAHRVDDVMRTLGRSPVALPLDEFQRAGGSAACLVSRVHEAPHRARMRTEQADTGRSHASFALADDVTPHFRAPLHPNDAHGRRIHSHAHLGGIDDTA